MAYQVNIRKNISYNYCEIKNFGSIKSYSIRNFRKHNINGCFITAFLNIATPKHRNLSPKYKYNVQ